MHATLQLMLLIKLNCQLHLVPNCFWPVCRCVSMVHRGIQSEPAEPVCDVRNADVCTDFQSAFKSYVGGDGTDNVTAPVQRDHYNTSSGGGMQLGVHAADTAEVPTASQFSDVQHWPQQQQSTCKLNLSSQLLQCSSSIHSLVSIIIFVIMMMRMMIFLYFKHIDCTPVIFH